MTQMILTQLETAKHQLDRSIEMLLDHQDYICSLTLAGAAEGILAGVSSKNFMFVRDEAARHFGNTSKEIADCFNETRNLLKHGTLDISTKAVNINVFESAFMISRAINALSHINGEMASDQVLKFIEWSENNKIFK